MTTFKKVVRISVFRPYFKVDFRNGPLMPRICTGAVLCRFLSPLWRFRYGVFNNYSDKLFIFKGGDVLNLYKFEYLIGLL